MFYNPSFKEQLHNSSRNFIQNCELGYRKKMILFRTELIGNKSKRKNTIYVQMGHLSNGNKTPKPGLLLRVCHTEYMTVGLDKNKLKVPTKN